MKHFLLLTTLLITVTSVSQEPLIFNRTRPVEVPTSWTPGVFFIESNSSSQGSELFVGGDFFEDEIQKATARIYRKEVDQWVTDVDFGFLPLDGKYEKAALVNDSHEDIIIYNEEGLAIYSGATLGNFTNVYQLDEDLSRPHITTFDYELDGDMDILLIGIPTVPYTIIQNNGNGNFNAIEGEGPKIRGVVKAGIIDGNWYVGNGGYGGYISIYKLNLEGLGFELDYEVRRPYRLWSTTILFEDFNKDGQNEIFVSGSTREGRYASELVLEYSNEENTWIRNFVSNFPGIGRGDIEFLDINEDMQRDAIITGQTRGKRDGLTKTFQIVQRIDDYDFGGLSQTFTDEFGEIIEFTFTALDVIQEDGLLKILVSGTRCYPEICPEAFLFTQVDCNDTLWYEDTDGDGFGDNYSVVCAVDQPEDYVSDNTDVFPNDENEWADQDGDGLGDNADQCDDTPEGDPIDEFGCSTILSVNSTDLNEKLKLYPNPAQNQITIELPFEDSDVTITVYNMFGQIVNVSETTTMNVSDLAKGQYVVKVQSATRVNIARFIKN